MLEFGRELFQMSQRLEKENGANETNRKMLEVSNPMVLFATISFVNTTIGNAIIAFFTQSI